MGKSSGMCNKVVLLVMYTIVQVDMMEQRF